MVFRGVQDSDPRTADLIMFGPDLALMERSVELCDMERRVRDEENRKMILTTPGLENAPYKPNVQTQSYMNVGDGSGRDVSFA